MTEPRLETHIMSDDYPVHVAIWPTDGTPRARVVILHGVQSHGGWYRRLGLTLSQAGYEVHFPDRRGSGANRTDRGHAPSAGRLIDDVAERLRGLRTLDPNIKVALAGISWGGKLVVVTAARHPELVDALALICPGLHPRVGVSFSERLRIALAYFTNRRKAFPIPLSDPALFTASPDGQRFIENDRLGLRAATAGLLAASTFIDRRVKKTGKKVRQPVLLMLAGQDRIVDNAKTRRYFDQLASADKQVNEYPQGHHTLEFELDPSRYALDLIAWLDRTTCGKPEGSNGTPR
jgi:alpha-beta hydrolase superfamily lysophospholipase